jgi:tRNA(adenine34) deaminase
MDIEHFMKEALKEAKKAFKKEEVPIGCVAVYKDEVLARGHNLREKTKNPFAHAEIMCLQKAAKKLGDWRLNKVKLFTTVSPCLLCAEAIIQSRIKEVFYGVKGPYKQGLKRLKAEKVKLHKNILSDECAKILKDFFKKARKK